VGNTPQDLKFGGVFFIMKNNTIRKLLNGLSGRTGAAMLAMGVVVILVVLKVIVSIISHSISISAQAMDSFS